MGFERMLVTSNSSCLHRTLAPWSRSSLSSLPGWASHSLWPNLGCFPPCWMLSGSGVWCCPWHPAGMAGQGDPEGGEVSEGWDQAPSGYQWNKRARTAPGASHSRRSQRADLFCFFPLPLLHSGVGGSCLWTPGEPSLFTRLSGRASAGMLLDRGADLSSPGFMHPQTRNQRCKAQTFCYLSPSAVQSAAAESNLVSAMPRFMVSQPHLRCWLPLGSRKPGLSHRSRMRGP